MNKIINKYLIINYLKTIINTVLIFLALGIILNLFEEIEFFKNLNQSFALPFILSLSVVPTLILDLLPFVVFLSAMFYFINIRSNKDLLSIKVFGYSNLKITFIIASFAFLFGFFVLIIVNPFTSGLVKYYEIEKAKYTRDIDHLISINKNGVWIRENNNDNLRIVTAKNLNRNYLEDVTVYTIDKNHEIKERIESKRVDISTNSWLFAEAIFYDLNAIDNKTETKLDYTMYSNYNISKLSSLYKNLDTVSFFNLISDYDDLNKKGYSKNILDEKLNSFFSLPLFLFLMVVWLQFLPWVL